MAMRHRIELYYVEVLEGEDWVRSEAYSEYGIDEAFNEQVAKSPETVARIIGECVIETYEPEGK